MTGLFMNLLNHIDKGAAARSGLGLAAALLATMTAFGAQGDTFTILGALSGMSAGILSDAGWRLSCWFCEPAHIIGSHGLAILGLTIAGSLVTVVADAPRWRRLRAAHHRPGE